MSLDQLFVVNHSASLKPDMSTTEWMFRTVQAGHRVWVADVDGLESWPDGSVVARAKRVEPAGSPLDMLAGVDDTEHQRVALAECDVVLSRTNPARDEAWRHDGALLLLADAAERGSLILNDPRTLVRSRSKLYLSRLPEHTRPRTLTTRDPEAIREFVRQEGRAVIKPTIGTHGRDVFVLDGPDLPNFNQIVDVLTRQGYPMVQSFVPEAMDGDTRILLVDGEPLEVDGKPAAVRRVPGGSDFRSNVHAGGQPAPAVLTPRLRQLVADVGPQIRRDGLFLVGLDVIGDRICEVNTFSPGGFGDASDFAGVDFYAALIDRVVDRVAAHRAG